MEEWQRNHITRNMVELVANTSCNTALLAALWSQNILYRVDVDEIESCRNAMGNQISAKKLYDIVQTRIGSFDILKKCLLETQQTGALDVLNDNKVAKQTYGRITYDRNKLIGRGCRGTRVFKGTFNGKNVAVKKIDCDDMEVELIRNEVRVLEMFQHVQNIVQIFAFEETPEYVLIALELCSISLRECAKNRFYPLDRMEILRQATDGLNHLHNNCFIHLDLKPSNILLKIDERATVKISDFGLSKRIHNDRSTYMSTGFGTLGWMAPEVARGEEGIGSRRKLVKMSPSSDIFSLGCIFYFTITDGMHPFGNSLRCELNMLENKFSLNESDIKCGGIEMIQLIEAMIHNDPKQRPTCEEILANKVFCLNKALYVENVDTEQFLVQDSIAYSTDMQLGTNTYKGYFGFPPIAAAVKILRHYWEDSQVGVYGKILDLIEHMSHPNLARYYAASLLKENIVIAVELCDVCLQQWLNEEPSSSSSISLTSQDILLQIASGLSYLHEKNITHKNLKPSNIWVSKNSIREYVKLSDYGVRAFQTEDSTDSTSCEIWAAPEVIEAVDEHSKNVIMTNTATDVFSLGCIFYYVLTKGIHPFGYTFQSQNSNIRKGEPKIYEGDHNSIHIRSNIQYILRMIEYDAEKRPPISFILQSSMFWSSQKAIQFLVDVSNFIVDVEYSTNNRYKFETSQSPSQLLLLKCIHDLERLFPIIAGEHVNDWLDKIVDPVRLYICQKNSYINSYGNSVSGLIRVIRNLYMHFERASADVQISVGREPDKFLAYWLEKFPLLVYHTREVFSPLKKENYFKQYY